MRGDCFGIKEHPVVETSNLDMMAGDGALFNNAYSAVPSCIAARASILTRLKPKSHGRVGYKDRVPWNYNTTLAGVC
jgi:arylsulfatase A-like enzyme